MAEELKVAVEWAEESVSATSPWQMTCCFAATGCTQRGSLASLREVAEIQMAAAVANDPPSLPNRPALLPLVALPWVFSLLLSLPETTQRKMCEKYNNILYENVIELLTVAP